MNDFVNKVTLITGAGRGVGREVAVAFASLGAIVAANDINPLNLDDTVSQILQAGGKARGYVFDVAKRMPIEGMLNQVMEHFGRIDILVNHASVKPDDSLLDMDEWEFHRTLDVNLGGPFFTMQQAGRIMHLHSGGAIVNLVTAARPDHFHKGHTAYSASITGLLGLTQVAAEELAAQQIRVNMVCQGSIMPGVIKSSALDPDQFSIWQEAQPRLQAGDHHELVSAVLFLCSPAASAINGRIIVIDNH